MRTKTVIILVIVAAILIGIVYGWSEYHREKESLGSIKAAYTTDAEKMLQEFESGDSVAEKKYLGKVVEVKGKISQVDKDSDGQYTIVLGGSGMSAVRCSMDSTINNRLLQLKEGDIVSVKGNFIGYQKDETGLLGSDIKLNRSVISKEK